jgi:prepilin-type N-terminal cleavage/methylation domain-containing protein
LERKGPRFFYARSQVNKKIITFSSNNQKARFSSAEKGMTLVEIVVVMAIMGVLAIVLYSNFRSTTILRELEGSARDIQTTLQRARFQAVRMRMNHRVSFVEENSTWYFNIEREDSPGVWNAIPGSIKRSIPKKFNVTVNFPNQTVMFSPLGFISNYNSSQNGISLQSAELQRNKQPDLRVINVYAGGTVKYAKTAS